ncbi:MAG: HEPN domain-containing protein [Pricia sp.]
MNIENRDDYVRYRFQRAKETLEEAVTLSENSKWNAAINRLYYSCFYAVIALLLDSEIETRSHQGARAQFGLHFIKTGLIDKKHGKLYFKLYDFRQKGDYGDFYDHTEDIVQPLIEKVEIFLSN